MSVEMLVERIPAEVGARVRTARTLRGWTLDQLAEHSGVSRRMIVNVEAGTSNASIATLLRLATALHVSLADVVSDVSPREVIVVTGPAGRKPLWRGSAGGTALLVASADTPDMLELWDWTMQPGDEYESEAHRPGTRELLHVIAGRLRLTINEDNRELGEGEAASFDAGVPHRYANEGKVPLRFMMTVLEPLVRVRP
jgi:transcriptional regulator with XRE-family HTH domain